MSHPRIHLLPCRIGYSGPAKVDQYFVVTPRPSTDHPASSTAEWESSFRGRALRGRTVQLPPGYKGTVYAHPTEGDDTSSGPDLSRPTRIFEEFVVWGHDQVDPVTHPAINLSRWIEVAEALHNDDFPDTDGPLTR
ncbi:ribonuclease H2, subunit C [Polychytrium aggregatum]|uniref:ribonuclease H2, subunit C n=1 Tax=Polychytrium aggregatum TaxID=110093 RepID=UPI0022FE2380|nr:ribonuclease H2, subunit C [Polychytrium aggregatum]KAI9199468.1 ribonuclease H2, subunit C [Polychytrium aggregatum]